MSLKHGDNVVSVSSAQNLRKSPASRISIVQPSLLGLMNEQAVLRLIQSVGPVSRIEAARQLGITAPTASKAVDSLLQSGWLEEKEDAFGTGGRGRPAKQLQLPGARAQVIGVVIDAYQCQIVAAGLDGVLRDDLYNPPIQFATPNSYDALIGQIADAVRKLSQRPDITTFGAGISLPGLVDPHSQRGILSPNLPLTNGRSPARDLGHHFDFPCVQIQEENALCLAERAYGKARGYEDFATLDISIGVGLSVVTGGRLLTGHRGLAGELGHITVVADGGRLCGCGNSGCLETETSETALARTISTRLGKPISVHDLALLMAKEEEDSTIWAEEIDRFLRFLAIGVATVINLFNVSAVFVHSAVLSASPSLFHRLIEETSRRALSPSLEDCQIVLTQENKTRGAVAGIMDYLIETRVPSTSNDFNFSQSHKNHAP